MIKKWYNYIIKFSLLYDTIRQWCNVTRQIQKTAFRKKLKCNFVQCFYDICRLINRPLYNNWLEIT